MTLHWELGATGELLVKRGDYIVTVCRVDAVEFEALKAWSDPERDISEEQLAALGRVARLLKDLLRFDK